jgi:tetratricopeptide (TPR) repeat protein
MSSEASPAAIGVVRRSGVSRQAVLRTLCFAGVFTAVLLSVWLFWLRSGQVAPLLREAERALARSDHGTAERLFRDVLKQDADNTIATDRLAYLFGLGTRTRELVPYQLKLLQRGDVVPRRLYILSLGDRFPTSPEIIEKASRIRPNDANILMGQADLAVRRGDPAGAVIALRRALQSRPELLEARVKVGQLLVRTVGQSSQAADEFLEWHRELPEAAADHPGIWIVFAEWALSQGWPREAIRCYWEAVRRDPNDQQANYQLGQLLVAQNQPEQAAPFLERARRLETYATTVYTLIARVEQTELPPADIRRAAGQAEELGLLRESLSWYRLALRNHPEAGWARDGANRLAARTTDLPLVRSPPEFNPAQQVDLSNYPLPEWNAGAAATVQREVALTQPSSVRFEDRAKSAGLNFQYVNGGDPLAGLFRVYEFTGGGAAVLDYDGDGWPDIHLTQGGQSPLERSALADQLFRNRGDGTFQNVTTAGGVGETGYSQGAAAGDFDDDGFPDLCVANIGANRLYRNNGDGTFADVTVETGTGGDRWTTSCLLADLNGDALLDLYAVNYLSGPDVYQRVCRDAAGPRASCLPQNFPAAQDQLFLNLGDGRFEEITESAGLAAPDGKGLGIVAADFDGSGKLHLFVANDAVPNFYFVNQTSARGTRPLFSERALAAGLAYDAAGRSQACMGVAADDADDDGLLDLFVTNFTEESNTLYRQFPGNLFVDVTRETGLREPSLAMLGFGTQFIDGELDGRPDLIVANGHIDDYRRAGISYQMPPQYFRNLGGGRFEEAPAQSLGPHFAGAFLGRGLARLDWNRDGREDVVISHLDAPAALLTNTTEAVGHFLAVRLRGVASDRDAIGATVTVRCGAKRWVKQLTAGDGYQASNQRQLVFGLGENGMVDELEVRWPSGRVEKSAEIPADAEILLIEGRQAPVPGAGDLR